MVDEYIYIRKESGDYVWNLQLIWNINVGIQEKLKDYLVAKALFADDETQQIKTVK